MAKIWFTYNGTGVCSDQKDPLKYSAVSYGVIICAGTKQVCALYALYTSTAPTLPAIVRGSATPGISPRLVGYINQICTTDPLAMPQPLSGKKYVYVKA